jgi:hypothetical protein
MVLDSPQIYCTQNSIKKLSNSLSNFDKGEKHPEYVGFQKKAQKMKYFAEYSIKLLILFKLE